MLAQHITRPGRSSGDTGLLSMALLVGLATGCGAIGFRYLIQGLTWVLTGERPPAELPDGAPVVAPTTGVAEALGLLHDHGGDGLAVVEHGEVVGWFTSAGVLAALRHR